MPPVTAKPPGSLEPVGETPGSAEEVEDGPAAVRSERAGWSSNERLRHDLSDIAFPYSGASATSLTLLGDGFRADLHRCGDSKKLSIVESDKATLEAAQAMSRDPR